MAERQRMDRSGSGPAPYGSGGGGTRTWRSAPGAASAGAQAPAAGFPPLGTAGGPPSRGGGGLRPQTSQTQPTRGGYGGSSQQGDAGDKTVGVIHKLLREKGYGFIRPTAAVGADEIFFALPGSLQPSLLAEDVYEGMQVRYTPALDARQGKMRASAVEKARPAMSSSSSCTTSAAGSLPSFAPSWARAPPPSGARAAGEDGSAAAAASGGASGSGAVRLGPACGGGWSGGGSGGGGCTSSGGGAVRLGPAYGSSRSGGGGGGGRSSVCDDSSSSAGGGGGASGGDGGGASGPVRAPPLSDLLAGGAGSHGAAGRWMERLLAESAESSVLALSSASEHFAAALSAQPPNDVMRRALKVLGRPGLTGSLLETKTDALFRAVLHSGLVLPAAGPSGRDSGVGEGESRLCAYCAGLPELCRALTSSVAEGTCADALSLLQQLHARFGTAAGGWAEPADVGVARAQLPAVACALRVALRTVSLPMNAAEAAEDALEVLLRDLAVLPPEQSTAGGPRLPPGLAPPPSAASWVPARPDAPSNGGGGGAQPPARIAWEAWREMPTFPLAAEVLGKEGGPLLRKNNVTGTYASVAEYLATHFWLLREDCVAPLRDGIAAYRAGRLDDRDMHVYEEVTVEGVSAFRQGVTYAVSFASPVEVQWEMCKRLLYGSLLCLSCDGTLAMLSKICFIIIIIIIILYHVLLCLSCDGFNGEFLWATVAERNPERCVGSRPQILIRMETGLDARLSNPNALGKRWVMVESPAYFEVHYIY
ncbi:hypothetical protein T492DRAFT_1151032 [Pavlovales sp. CCMP2436]|nr:hypothetical protein T492DRAFT_1151032 [Pavlovales sp. CCMP2436]